jgi:hypothetical protein
MSKETEDKKPVGLYNVIMLEKLGTLEKGQKTKMEYTTAKALETKKLVKIGSKADFVPVSEK